MCVVRDGYGGDDVGHVGRSNGSGAGGMYKGLCFGTVAIVVDQLNRVTI